MDIHTLILETYFFELHDRGIPPQQTPLFTGHFDERPLAEVLIDRFQLTPADANKAIELARKEVEL